MSNMRIIFDNAVDRATVTASSTAGALIAANLLTDRKSDVWRATGPAASIFAAWPTAEAIQAVALPFCNLSPTATMRVRLTNELSTTNMAGCSQRMGRVPWNIGTGGSMTEGSGTAPDGTNTANTYTHATGTTRFAYLTQIVTNDASLAWTFSIWVRTVSGTDSVTLAISDVTGSTKTSSSQAVTTTWKRLTFSVTAGQLASTSQLGFGLSGTPGTVYQLWGAQLEAGSVATSYYQAVTSGPATRPLGYMDSWQTYSYDSGAQLACPAPALRPRGWTAAQAASAYAFGGGAYARAWLPAALQAYGMAVDIIDSGNLQGYVEAARLVAGLYWSPAYNASNASMTVVDTTELYRTDAGDQGANAGYVYRRVPIDVGLMPAADRATCVRILRSSRAYPVFVSVYPEVADLALERDYMVYGRRSKDSDIAIEYATTYSTTIEIEET